jgi:para-nitrobenzyl esterase
MKKLLSICATVMLAVLVSGCCCNQKNGSAVAFDPDAQQVVIGEDIAVAPTTYGKVRGFIMRGIYNFRGIPYGAPTGGENRFMPPREPEPWEGVRPTVAYGASAPQTMYDQRPESYGMFVDHWNYDLVNEDCLRLNVWTPALDAKKRPVLVWMHGGGYARGNGIEQDSYNGENFARTADAVFVSINHRLNVFGFSDLSKVGGEKYKNSGNVGMLDIIAALQWVNKNIEAFGGDPANVTIMGQSGGGSKVCTVASMPAAKGLVHKGVPLSGNTTRAGSKADAELLGEYIVKEAGLEPSEIDKLQQMPWQEYMAIAEAASVKMRQVEGRGVGFSPIGDGVNIPAGTFFDPNDPNIPDIPMLFSSTYHEWNPNRDNPELESITLDGVAEKLEYAYGENAKTVVDAYAKQFPEMRPIEIWALISSNRQGIVNSANVKLGQKSPVYMAWFGWESPLFDGRHRAFHCIDISFWFLNTDLMVTHTGGGKKPRVLAEKMASALADFMRTGDPNTKMLPEWPKYTKESGQTMILDDECVVKNDPDREARELLSQYNRGGRR